MLRPPREVCEKIRNSSFIGNRPLASSLARAPSHKPGPPSQQANMSTSAARIQPPVFSAAIRIVLVAPSQFGTRPGYEAILSEYPNLAWRGHISGQT